MRHLKLTLGIMLSPGEFVGLNSSKIIPFFGFQNDESTPKSNTSFFNHDQLHKKLLNIKIGL